MDPRPQIIDAGGRGAMNDICPTEDPQAHFCRREEIENAWVITGVYFSPTITETWVEYYTEGDWSQSGNTCGAWSMSSEFDNGWQIRVPPHEMTRDSCDNEFAVACCKQMP
jgi:hypothetical protein